MPITALPTPVPTRSDPTNFAARADAFLAALPAFATEANALQTDVNAKQTAAGASATAADTSATNAANSATLSSNSAAAAVSTIGSAAWNAGTAYTAGQVVYDTTDFLTYRRKVSGTTGTRPGLDTTNWVLITETIYATVIPVAALNIDVQTGVYFSKTIAGNSAFTFSNPPTSGIALTFTLEITHTSGVITWPTSVSWPKGSAPVLLSPKTHIFTFTTIDGGAKWRGAALTDYTT